MQDVGVGYGRSIDVRQRKPQKSSHSFGAHFVEVSWQPEIARLRVRRVVKRHRRRKDHQSERRRAIKSKARS